jgi:hypothetical protein
VEFSPTVDVNGEYGIVVVNPARAKYYYIYLISCHSYPALKSLFAVTDK